LGPGVRFRVRAIGVMVVPVYYSSNKAT